MNRPEAQVDRYFEQLHRAVLAAPGTATPLDNALQVLREYELQLRATEDAIKRGAPPPSDSLVMARIKGEADRMPPPLNTLLAGPGLEQCRAGCLGCAGRHPEAGASRRSAPPASS